MAISRDDKLLNGVGLSTYTGLLKTKLDGITTSIAGDITNAISTAISTVVGDATTDGDTLGKLEDRVDSAEQGLETVITEVFGEYPGVEPSRIDDLEDAVNGLTTTVNDLTTTVIPGITNTIAGLTETYKVLQTAATLNAPAGEYISGITQDAQGVVGITTLALPTVPAATTATLGVVQMADGATTSIVYSKEQIDDAASQLTEDILGSVLEDFKQKQTAYSSGVTTNLTFIDYIYQNEQGVITTTMATITLPSSATEVAEGLVTMAGGATTSIVYNTVQVDNLVDVLEDRVDGITTILNGISTPLDENFKALQTAATLSVPAGEYVTRITQDIQGVVGITTAAFPTASSSTPGMVQIVGVTTTETHPVNQVYSRDKVDELLAEIEGGGSATYKKLQDAKTITIPSGYYISQLDQDDQGVITAVTSTLPAAATNSLGLVQYSTGVTVSAPRVYDTVEVDKLIAEAEAAAFVAAITTTLPASGDANTIYFVSNGTGTTPNYYTEYMYVNGGWEVVGDTELTIEALSDNEIEDIFEAVFPD